MNTLLTFIVQNQQILNWYLLICLQPDKSTAMLSNQEKQYICPIGSSLGRASADVTCNSGLIIFRRELKNSRLVFFSLLQANNGNKLTEKYFSFEINNLKSTVYKCLFNYLIVLLIINYSANSVNRIISLLSRFYCNSFRYTIAIIPATFYGLHIAHFRASLISPTT